MVDAPSPLRRSARGATIHAAAGVAQLVEHQLPKLRVVGSSPIARFDFVASCAAKREKPPRGTQGGFGSTSANRGDGGGVLKAGMYPTASSFKPSRGQPSLRYASLPSSQSWRGGQKMSQSSVRSSASAR